jgi:uncharacterized membrane protein YoaK (UPF0700 family)
LAETDLVAAARPWQGGESLEDRPEGVRVTDPPPSGRLGAPASQFARAWFADPRHGPLPVLLLALTVNTGVVDAVSILSLGRVFVANMTGNVVFVGFAAAGAPGFSLSASLWALGGFVAGAYFGGVLVRRIATHRGRLFAVAVVIETVLLLAALLISAAGGRHLTTAGIDAIAASAAAALGLQNAIVRKLAVPDLTTTVLTMTLTGIAADTNPAGRGATIVRRALAVTAMFAGAVVGALIVLHDGRTAGLGLAVGLVAVVSVSAVVVARGSRAWHTAAT